MGSATATMTPTVTVAPTITPMVTATPSSTTTRTATTAPSATMTLVPPTVPPTAGTPGPEPLACPGLEKLVPQPVIDNALANPADIQGWGWRCNPNVPPSIWNGLRHYLALQSANKPYHPTWNRVIYKCGCP